MLARAPGDPANATPQTQRRAPRRAGAYFGLAWGALLVYAGNVLGQTAAFLLARYCFRDAVQRCVAARWRHFDVIDAAVQREGATLVCILRVNPCMPYTILNYALGLTRITFAAYSWSSALSIVPFVVAYVYMGCLSGNVMELLEGGWAAQGAMLPWALASSVLVCATVVYGFFVTKRALTDALEGALAPDEAPRSPEQHSAGSLHSTERHRALHTES